jgi:hypothetical protein
MFKRKSVINVKKKGEKINKQTKTLEKQNKMFCSTIHRTNLSGHTDTVSGHIYLFVDI